MPTFDRQLWIERAHRRHKRAPNARAGAKLELDLRSIDQLQTLVDWCIDRKIMVEFKQLQNGEYDGAARSIAINNRASPERQLYILLHECGHHLIGEPSPDGRFGCGHRAYIDDNPNLKRTTVHRVDVVDEELEAWARGLKLANRLGIKLDLNRYNRVRSMYVRSYMLWAVNRGPWFD